MGQEQRLSLTPQRLSAGLSWSRTLYRLSPKYENRHLLINKELIVLPKFGNDVMANPQGLQKALMGLVRYIRQLEERIVVLEMPEKVTKKRNKK